MDFDVRLCSLHIGQVYSNYKRGLDSRATTFQESRQKSLDIAFDLLLKDNRQRAINSENGRRGGGSGGIEGISVHVFRDLVHELSEYGTNVPSFDGHASNAAHTQQAAAAGSPSAAAAAGAGAGGGAGVGGVATIDEEQGGGGGIWLGLPAAAAAAAGAVEQRASMGGLSAQRSTMLTRIRTGSSRGSSEKLF